MTDQYTLFFAPMKTVIAISQTTKTSTVVAVDIVTGFTDFFLADNIHYNKAGDKFITERYYNKIVPLLN